MLDFALTQIYRMPSASWTSSAYLFRLKRVFEERDFPLWYGHLLMLAALKDARGFHNILDLGSNDGMASHIFHFIGKKVTSLEPADVPDFTVYQDTRYDSYPVDIKEDYLKVNFENKFDAIWCSHVLEHVRNTGLFLDKIFDDLKVNGKLYLVVPNIDFELPLSSLLLGHYTKYTLGTLVYQLVSAGFDCSSGKFAIHERQIYAVVTKQEFGSHFSRGNTAPFFPDSSDQCKMFPVKVSDYGADFSKLQYINWDYPITPEHDVVHFDPEGKKLENPYAHLWK